MKLTEIVIHYINLPLVLFRFGPPIARENLDTTLLTNVFLRRELVEFFFTSCMPFVCDALALRTPAGFLLMLTVFLRRLLVFLFPLGLTLTLVDLTRPRPSPLIEVLAVGMASGFSLTAVNGLIVDNGRP